MQKPITVAREEFIETMINTINESGLPAFVIADILTDLLSAINELKVQQYKKDLEAYKAEPEVDFEEI
jgi:hypothetical protein